VAVREVRVVTPDRVEKVQAELAGESPYVMLPVPEPPVVVKVTVALSGLEVLVFETVNVACAPKNVKVTAAEVAEEYVASAALVDVTEQVVAAEAVT